MVLPKIKPVVILAVLGLVVLTFLLRHNSLNSPFERDEGEYAYSANLLLTGSLPYRDSFLQKPPLIIYTYAVAKILFGNNLWGPRLLATFFVIGASLTTGFIAAKKYCWLVGLVAAFLLPFMLSFPYLAGLAANTEVFMVWPLVGVVAIYERVRRVREVRVVRCVAAGLLASLAVLYKPIAILPLGFLFVAWWWGRRRWQEVLLVGLGGAVVATLALGYFIWRGAWPAFWEEVIVFNSYYSAQFGFGLGNLVSRFQVLWAQWWFLFLLLAWFIYRKPTQWWFYLGLFLTSLLAVYQSPIGHYYLLLMPFWAIIAAWSVNDLKQLASGKVGLVGSGGVVVATFLLLLVPIREQFTKTPAEITAWVYGQGNPFLESELVAQKLATATGPSDKVFVAGSEPQLLDYAHRQSVSRSVITYPLIINTPRRLDYQNEVVAALQQNPPAAIVVSTREESGLWNKESPRVFIDHLSELLNKSYKLQGGFVWASRGGEWLDTLTNDDIKNASLLLFCARGQRRNT
jgi:hypothetical protein